MKETFKKRPVKNKQPRRAKLPVAPESLFLGIGRQDKAAESIQQNNRRKSGQHGGLRCRARTRKCSHQQRCFDEVRRNSFFSSAKLPLSGCISRLRTLIDLPKCPKTRIFPAEKLRQNQSFSRQSLNRILLNTRLLEERNHDHSKRRPPILHRIPLGLLPAKTLFLPQRQQREFLRFLVDFVVFNELFSNFFHFFMISGLTRCG